MDDQGLEYLKKLIASIEGAPYPHTVKNELYSIWHEHALNVATDALGYINQNQKRAKGKLPQSIKDESDLSLS